MWLGNEGVCYFYLKQTNIIESTIAYASLRTCSDNSVRLLPAIVNVQNIGRKSFRFYTHCHAALQNTAKSPNIYAYLGNIRQYKSLSTLLKDTLHFSYFQGKYVCSHAFLKCPLICFIQQRTRWEYFSAECFLNNVLEFLMSCGFVSCIVEYKLKIDSSSFTVFWVFYLLWENFCHRNIIKLKNFFH